MNTDQKEPSQEVTRLAERRLDLEGQLKEVRAQLADAIRADTSRGVRQVEIVKVTKYTREQVRRICDPQATK